MGVFGSYISSIMTVGICAFICETVSGHFGQSKALSKGLSLITSLCLFITVLSPLLSSASDFNLAITENKNSIQAEQGKDYLMTMTKIETEKKIKEIIFEETGIDIYSASIELKEDNGVLNISEVTVVTDKSHEFEKESISDCVTRAVGKQAKVVIKDNE